MLDYFSLQIALSVLSLIAFSSLITAWPFKSKAVNPEALTNSEEPVEGQLEEGANFEERTANRSLVQQFGEDLKILRLPSFWVVTIFYVVFIYVFVVFIIVLPDLAVDRGLSRQSAAFLLSIHSVGDFAGRLIPGYLHYLNIVQNQVGTKKLKPLWPRTNT